MKKGVEEKMSGEDERRSSLVSLLQRKMSRGGDSVESCGSSASEPGQRQHYRLIILGRESYITDSIIESISSLVNRIIRPSIIYS